MAHLEERRNLAYGVAVGLILLMNMDDIDQLTHGVATALPPAANDVAPGGQIASPSPLPVADGERASGELERLVAELAVTRGEIAMTRARRQTTEDELHAALRREVEAARERLANVERRHRNAMDQIRTASASAVSAISDGRWDEASGSQT